MKREGMRNLPVLRILGCVSVAAALVAVKLWGSGAGAQELRFLLTPVSWLVEMSTGQQFAFDAGMGFINDTATIIIAPACSGLNFLLITMTMLALMGVMFLRSCRELIPWLLLVPFLAYGVTLGANTLRILLSIWLYAHEISCGYWTMARLHRLAGIAIYYPVLLALLWGGRRLLQQQSEWSSVVLMLPLVCYTGVCLGGPLMRGQISPLFYEHGITVILVTGSITVGGFFVSLVLPHVKRDRQRAAGEKNIS